MKYRRLGRTGFEVSEVGFGAWGLGGNMWLGVPEEEGDRALETALDLGVNFIDTALVYGEGWSEQRNGKVLGKRPERERIRVATKIPPRNFEWPGRAEAKLREVFSAVHVAASRTLRAQGPVDPRVIDAARSKLAELRAEAGNNKSAFGALDSVVSGAIGKWSALLGGAGLGVFAKMAFDAGASAQSIKTAFDVIFGSAAAGAEELEFVRKTSKNLNLEFESTVKAYQQLAAASQGTALAGKPTRDIFVAISQASTALGLSADQTSGALEAVEQMMSKGKVQAEELRGQLGERLPGAFGLAAKAMGVTTAELDNMLKAGEVTAEDLLPRLAQALQDRFAGGVEKAKNNAVQSINALKNAWYDLCPESPHPLITAGRRYPYGTKSRLTVLDADHSDNCFSSAVLFGVRLRESRGA